MQTPSAADLLNIWECGQSQSALQRALVLLAAAHPESSTETLAELSIGQRDAGLLALRERLFGPRLNCLATCPDCDEQLELNFDVRDISPQPISGPSDLPEETLFLRLDGYEVQFRLPNSRDMVAIAENDHERDPRQLLLQRCILSSHFHDDAQQVDTLPQPIITAIVEQMAAAEPQADLQLALTCPACNYRWETAFDIVSFLWTEIDYWAGRILHEVHLLASAYGWREADILALSPWRRQFYLNRIQT